MRPDQVDEQYASFLAISQRNTDASYPDETPAETDALNRCAIYARGALAVPKSALAAIIEGRMSSAEAKAMVAAWAERNAPRDLTEPAGL